MKEFEKCIEQCDIAVSKSKGDNYDGHKMCKALGRKGNALAQQHKYPEAIECFKNGLMEYNDNNVRSNMNSTVKAKTKWDAEQYLDADKAEEHKVAGNEKFKAGDYPAAIKEFDEGLKRDPKNKNLYSNRCAALIKLNVPVDALKDAEKCLELDPKFAKAYAKKGNCHVLLREYHKAMRAFEQGLELDPANAECT
jgi:stress-induced-phosphoprotein 1